MSWEDFRSAFRKSNSALKNDVKSIQSRPPTERETGWIREILQANDEWRDADISRTQVVAEGSCDDGISLLLQAPEQENAKPGLAMNGVVGNLWIRVSDGSVINVQLSQSDGRLREIYVLFVDPKHIRRKLPETWIEVSHEAVSM